jgi:probable phosphoglycerate mutase
VATAAHIWLIRHGETQWSRDGRHTGRTDLPLTPAGEDAARALAPAVAALHPALVLCSPLARARRTAELAGLVPDDIDPDLAEWDYGAWEGRTTTEIREDLGNPSWLIWDTPVPPGATPGEQMADVAARAARVIARCAPVLDGGKDCVLIAHGHLLRFLAATWLGEPPVEARHYALDPATLSALGFEHAAHVITRWNAPV